VGQSYVDKTNAMDTWVCAMFDDACKRKWVRDLERRVDGPHLFAAASQSEVQPLSLRIGWEWIAAQHVDPDCWWVEGW